MRSPADPADVEEQPSDGGLDAEDIKFLRSLRTSATPGPSSDGEAGERGIARRLSSRTVKKLEVASDEIELQPSVWDSAPFQFASVSGRGASVFTLVLLVVNILMQGSFAFYLMDGLTEKPITHNDIDELRWWRRNVAHSLEYYSEEHRGDRDCSLRCPEREPATPTCPAHQEAIWVREGRRPGHCPRLPRSQLLDVGVDHGGMMGEMS